jgi:hypothetical protein
MAHFVQTEKNNTLFEVGISYIEEGGYQYIEPRFSVDIKEYSNHIMILHKTMLPNFVDDVDRISEISDIWWKTKEGKEKYGSRIDDFVSDILKLFCEKWNLNYITD